jgi:hypothetical protein
MGGQLYTLFLYQTVTSSYDPSANTSNDTTSRYSVVSFMLEQKFVELFVRRKDWLDHTNRYSKDQQIQLEGDFNKYFDVFMPTGTQIEALSLLTPDVMQFLEQAGREYDLHVNGHTVTVIAGDQYVTPEGLPVILKFITELTSVLNRKPFTAADTAPDSPAALAPAGDLSPQLKPTNTSSSRLFKVIIISLFSFIIVSIFLMLAFIVLPLLFSRP